MADVNPYQAPQSTVATYDKEPYGQIKLFSLIGRLSRLQYFGYGIGINLLAGLLFGLLIGVTIALSRQTDTTLLGPAINLVGYVLGCVVILTLGVQRLHDINASGWWWLLMFIPVVNIIFGLVLLFTPGTPGANRYGYPPPPNSKTVIALALVIPVVAVTGILAAILIPVYQNYVHQAQPTSQPR